MQILYPQEDKSLCACGCGQKLEGRRKRWATKECQEKAVQIFFIIKGDISIIRKAQVKHLNLKHYRWLLILSPQSGIIRKILSERRNMSKRVKELRDKNLLKSISYGFIPKIGKVEQIHYLTPKGKRLLEDNVHEELEIKMPIGRSNFFSKIIFTEKAPLIFR